MASISSWIQSFRLHTLPLALSTIIMGSFLAAFHQEFKWSIFILALLTTLFLQILSNLANDYGDTEKGVDNDNRIGPRRALQAGAITRKQMRNAILIFTALALFSGVWLIVEGTKGLVLSYGIILFVLGLAAIAAAVKYTMGRNPYGYQGLGDLFVFLFFGLTGVMGTYFLHTHNLSAAEFLPAISMGCFSTGVLNLNNLRDRENDSLHNKHTLVVKLGLAKAKWYHALLLTAGMLSAVVYTFIKATSPIQWIYLISFAGIINSILVVMRNERPEKLYPELKKLSLSTLVFAVLFGAGLIL